MYLAVYMLRGKTPWYEEYLQESEKLGPDGDPKEKKKLLTEISLKYK